MSRLATSGPPGDKAFPTAPRRPSWWRIVIAVFGILLTLGLLFVPTEDQPEDLTYSAFMTELDAGRVDSVSIGPDGGVAGILSDDTAFETRIPIALDQQDLSQRLADEDVEITATSDSTQWWSALLSFLPMLIIVGVWVWMSRKGKGIGALGGVGKSKVKVIDTERPTTRFADVAGYEGVKRELREVVSFLKEPEQFRAAGAIGPRGALMVGPPGTGKTLIARAVAGEAAVPFLSVTGSAFVEMYVGVGASRVRDLFAQARKRAPAIIFVDEIDAIGQRRGSGNVSNDEREQTLNQLLAEMDGFDPADGIVVLAATNRPEVLDPALLRPGRFDREIVVPLPTLAERRSILELHCANKALGPDVDLDAVSRGTPGFSGADLANLANEAAIFAVRHQRTVLEQSDFDEARSRIVLGRRDGSNILLPSERHAVAVHESGHALVAALSDHADPVAKVTILPAGQSLGATEQLPVDERHLYSESHLTTSLAIRLGGRAGELVVFDEGSTGAASDLVGATDLATRMVREFGLSPKLGPIGYPAGGSMYLGSERVSSRTYSEVTQAAIDDEVARLVGEAEATAVELLTEHRGHLDALTELLLENETVDGDDVYELIGRQAPTAEQPTPAVTFAPPSPIDTIETVGRDRAAASIPQT